MAAAENGPINPYSAILSEITMEMVVRLQPNSCSSGRINTDGVARMPAAASSTRKMIATTIHA